MSTFPTLSKQPSYPLSPDGDLADMVLRTPSDGGYVQTRPKFTRALRSWGVNYPNLPDADVTTLRTFETTTLVNGSDIFTWTHPVSGSFTVRLVSPIKFARATDAANATNVSLTLQEV